MNEYMLAIHGSFPKWKQLGPEEIQEMTQKYYAFADRLRKEGRFKSGSGLTEESTYLKSDKGQIICDGPYPETRETLFGYLVFEASDQIEAVEIARTCPALLHGAQVQVVELAKR